MWNSLQIPNNLPAWGIFSVIWKNRNLTAGKEAGQIIKRLVKKLEAEGFAAVCESGNVPGNLAMPRKQEVYACVNRYRGMKVVKKKRDCNNLAKKKLRV